MGAEKPYLLLLHALRSANKTAVARFVMRTKQYRAAIRPIGDVLGLHTMHFPDEVRPTDTVDNQPGEVALADREMAMAEQLVDSLTSPWDKEELVDALQRHAS